jgi:vacuolar-type H+-ATPase subunit I/STV1
VETYTLREAAELTGTTVAAMRKKADREQLRTVLREGVRRVPRSELERLGLPVEPRPAATTEVISELLARLEQQAAELASLRQLPQRIQHQEQEHAAELAASLEMREQAEQEAAELRLWRERVASAGWLERRRLVRKLRTA